MILQTEDFEGLAVNGYPAGWTKHLQDTAPGNPLCLFVTDAPIYFPTPNKYLYHGGGLWTWGRIADLADQGNTGFQARCGITAGATYLNTRVTAIATFPENGYSFIITPAGNISLNRWNGGGLSTNLASGIVTAPGWNASDFVAEITSIGSTHNCYINGVLELTAVDAVKPSGKCVFGGFFGGTGIHRAWDNFIVADAPIGLSSFTPSNGNSLGLGTGVGI